MADRPPKILICSCEDTMPLDGAAVQRGCRGAEVLTARQLCRAELDKFRAAAAGGDALLVGCTQEAPLFSEVAGDVAVSYANIRETAGWSKDADAAGPKMAALLAAAAEPVPELAFVNLTSDGVILIYGRDEQAIEAGNLLKDHLDVTVLIKPPAELAPPRVTDFPVVKGAIRSGKGYLGAFELTVDGYAQPAPSSRGALRFADGSRRRGVALRPRARHLRRRAAVHRVGSARRLSARRSRRSRRRAEGGAQGARSRRQFRQTALRDVHRGSLRPFALSDHRLHALPRSLPDRRDHACRRSRRHRRPYLRGLRTMRRRLSDRRRGLCAAAGRCAAAQAARAADRLSRMRTARSRPIVLVHDERARRAADRRAGAFRRWPAGERSADRRQRGDPGRSRSHRRGVRLRRGGGALAAARQAAPRCRRA